MVIRKDYPYVLLALVLTALAATAVADPGESVGTFALLGLMGVAVIMAIIINPSLGAYVLILAVFSNVSRQLTDQGLPGVIKPLVVVVFVAIVIRNYYIGGIPSNRPRTARVEIALIAYFVAVAASFLVASDRDLALERVIDLAKDIVIIYCILFSLRRLQDWKQAIFIVVLATTALSLLGLYQVASGDYGQTFLGFARVDTSNRLAGPINEPNMWGQVLAAVVPFAVFGFLRGTPAKKLFYAVSIVILMAELLNTYSRGAYLAVLVGLFLIMFFFTRFNPIFAFSVVAIAVLLFPFLPAQYVARFQSISILAPSTENGVYQDASFRGRASELRTGLVMFATHPILGVGAANYPVNYQTYTQLIGMEVRTDTREAHSLYIEVLAETGVIGSVAFLGMLFFIFQALARIKADVRNSLSHQKWISHISAMQVSLLSYLFAALFLHGAYIRFLWILLALALTLVLLLHEDMNDPSRANKSNRVVA
ncbi:MAG: O-antigen ligase family protein [Chloroflexi bacterium]|nr:O-antigen ligase family protein [Chloroflexota bacterium]